MKIKTGVLTKLSDSETPEFADNIKNGRTEKGGAIKKPTVGEVFIMASMDKLTKGLMTSTVKEILIENDDFVKFRTNNSIYLLVYVK